MPKENYDSIMNKYRAQLRSQVSGRDEAPGPIASREYKQFKSEYLKPHQMWYEKACNLSEKIVKIPPSDKKKEAEMQQSIDTCHLNITPTGVVTFSFLGPIAFIAAGIFLSSLIPLLFGAMPNSFFIAFFLATGLAMILPLANLPKYYAMSWRLKASNQMVLCVFYVVTYMRHTSNLELAIEFAADHLGPPMSLDMKKVIWDVETEKYESVKESLDHYLESWKTTNPEFVEAFNLIISSLYESSEDRRLFALDKSLTVILEETYEKMLHYAQNLKQPITMLHMMGIMLPILSLVILPLAVSFMADPSGIPIIKWYHLLILYNVLLPFGVFYLGKSILSTRPSGYGDTDISDADPELKKYKNVLINIGGVQIKIPPMWIAIIVFMVLFMIGISPLIMHNIGVQENTESAFRFLDYKCPPKNMDCTNPIGPFGTGAAVASLAITLAFGLSLGLYFKLKSQNVIKIRDESKKLEDEFASALFQLGNRLGDNLPVEIAVEKVAEVTQGSTSGDFFRLVSSNISRQGMGIEQAIFDKKVGALTQYPSALISSSMKVLVESAKKGPMVASQAIISVSEYVKQIHRVDERLKDLMADIISSMKSQIKFMTPVIAGIVVGITSMITVIMGKIIDEMQAVQVTNQASGTGSAALPTEIFGIGMPTFYFQIIVGLYVVEIVYILTILTNGIENGSDSLAEKYSLGTNLVNSTILYCAITLVVIVVFNLIGSTLLAGRLGAM